jgi:hypothetical protein
MAFVEIAVVVEVELLAVDASQLLLVLLLVLLLDAVMRNVPNAFAISTIVSTLAAIDWGVRNRAPRIDINKSEENHVRGVS